MEHSLALIATVTQHNLYFVDVMAIAPSYSREKAGVTQGDPLSMVLYGLSLTPLAEAIRNAVPRTVQPWYADDAAMVGPIPSLATAQRLLLQLGP